MIYGQPAPMTSRHFKSLASELMSSRDAALLDYCTLEPEDAASAAKIPSKFIKRWKEWERALRLNLARNRAVKIKREGVFEAPGYPADAVVAAKSAVAAESPLEAELFLDKARWDAIESFQGINTFSRNAMFAYMLKLLLMERRAAFITEEGYTEYKGLYSAIMDLQASGEPK